jgi:predicted porin
MKTLLLASISALVCCSPGARAQAPTDPTPSKESVRIYGDLDVGFGRFKQPGSSAVKRVESGLLAPSYLGFAGDSDIGNGAKAVFALETYIGLDNGVAFNAFSPTDPFWGRSAYVGVSGSLGTLTLGRNKNPFYYAATASNAFEESYFSPALTVAAFRRGHVIGRAHDNSIRYTSPTVGGFTGAALWAPKEAQTNGDDMSATVQYARGGWVAVLGGAQAKSGLTEGTASKILLAATNYDFGVLRAFVEAAWQRDTDVQVKSRAWDVGITAPFGQTTLRVSLARIRQTDLSGGNLATERVASIGADYALAKRCILYGGIKSDKVSGASNGTSVAAGMRLLF